MMTPDQKAGNLSKKMVETYYKEGDLKETYWRVIDGKYYYYFDPLSGEMVVGWQYIPFPSKGSTPVPPKWYQIRRFSKVRVVLLIKMECYKSLLVGKH